MNFKDRLIEKIEYKHSIVCVGIDPDIDASQFPPEIRDHSIRPKENFAWRIIDAVHDIVPCIKINTRFFMPDEHDQLQSIVDHAHRNGLLVIGDCKQNDIGSTMAMAYKNEFGYYDWDAITVNGYFGSDGISGSGIFNEWHEKGKGLFVLIKTSNKSSSEFQDIPIFKDIFPVEYIFNYIKMAELVEKWSSMHGHSIGGVVGATHPDQIEEVSKIMNGILLLPGYGAQGGDANALDKLANGKYCIVNSSRGIMYAHDRRFKDKYTVAKFEQAARAEVEFMNEDLNKHFKPFNGN